MPTSVEQMKDALQRNAGDFRIQLNGETCGRMGAYYEFLLKWNERLHLVAPCPAEEFATRHILESLLLLPHLPQGARIADVGSGGGLPIIPCLIARGDIRATLIESSKKKAVFLREALRVAGVTDNARVIAARFEETPAPESDYVTSRALDRFAEQLPRLIDWAPTNRTLLIFGGEALHRKIEPLFPDARAELVPQSERRFLIIAARH